MISIIVPVYNAEKFIDETINSVLSQTEKDFELILVNDCSTDSSVERISRFDDARIRLVNMSDNLGAWAARNRGLEEAGGRYIAFLDADDLWDSRKLEAELEYMNKTGASFVFTGYEFADENGKGNGTVVHVPKKFSYKRALNNTTIFTSTVLLDREIIPDRLMRMPDIKSEDTATWWNILKEGYTAYGLDMNLVKYRRSAGSLSSDKFEAIRRIWRLYREIAKLSVFESALHFICWAFTAVLRRI